MEEEIVNRVANSKLEVIDLEDYYPEGDRILIDISQWLEGGIILVEKKFRTLLKSVNWNVYKDTYVALHCATDAIVPSWAYNLVASNLTGKTRKTVVGDLNLLESLIYQEVINSLDFDYLDGKPVIIKGCSKKPVPESAYVLLADKIQDKVVSIMYGEACSAVPIVKNKRS